MFNFFFPSPLNLKRQGGRVEGTKQGTAAKGIFLFLSQKPPTAPQPTTAWPSTHLETNIHTKPHQDGKNNFAPLFFFLFLFFFLYQAVIKKKKKEKHPLPRQNKKGEKKKKTNNQTKIKKPFFFCLLSWSNTFLFPRCIYIYINFFFCLFPETREFSSYLWQHLITTLI